MIITQPAFLCLAASHAQVVEGPVARWLRRFGRAEPVVPKETLAPALVRSNSAPEPTLSVIDGPSPGPSTAPESDPLSGTERRARAAALRGLLLARQRRFPAAERAFAEAIRFDPALDLATIPTFWEMERAAHEGIVRVYDQEGQGRRASILAARLQERFRPRLLPLRVHVSDPTTAAAAGD